MSKKFRIRMIRCEDGERLPVLFAPDGTVPFLPALYVMQVCRPRDSANTILIKLEAIKFLYSWAFALDININVRFKSEEMLTLKEIDSLVYASRLEYRSMLEQYSPHVNPNSKSISNFKPAIKSIDYMTQSKRLNNIAIYLEWLTSELSKNISRSNKIFKTLELRIKNVASIIRLKSPKRIGKSTSRKINTKKINDEQRKRLIAVIEPNHPDNPWKNEFVKLRNQLYIVMLYALGIRRGESLKLKAKDFRRSNSRPVIEIRRRPDDLFDSRTLEPNVKTNERPLRIGRALFPLLCMYIDRYWNRLTKAKKHGYLFVSRNGNPLSLDSANKVFQTLSKIDGLPDNLTPHLLRHDWNYRFSINGMKRGYTMEDLREPRRLAMGWTECSRMPEHYDHIFIQERTDAILMSMQSEYFKDL